LDSEFHVAALFVHPPSPGYGGTGGGDDSPHLARFQFFIHPPQESKPDRPCAWQLIYKRLKEIGQLDRLKEIKPPKNWRPSQSGGCRTIIREDHRV
jgi:hypothetical protein